MHWRRYLDLRNPRLSPECIDIIAGLCCDQQERLGRGGAQEVKAHSWFGALQLVSSTQVDQALQNGATVPAVDFSNLRQVQPEFVPRVVHAEDTSNFDTFEVHSDEFFRTAQAGGTAYNPAFFDFTFRHFFACDGVARGPNPTARAQQRPSLAHLINSRRADLAEGGPGRDLGPAPHPIFNKPLRAPRPSHQQSAIYSTFLNSAAPAVAHPAQKFDAPQEADEDDLAAAQNPEF